MKRAIVFFQEVKAELERVNWPGKERVKQYTVIVIVFSLAVAAFLGFMDFLLNWGLQRII